FWREKHVAARQRQKLRNRAEPNDRIFFRRRHEDRAIAHDRHAEVRRVVAVRPEQHAVVLVAVRAEMLEQRRHLRSVLEKPCRFVVGRRAAARNDVVELGEVVRIARTVDGKPKNADRPDHARARRIRVLPGQVVRRTACEDRDVVMRGEPLRNAPTVRFRSADDVEPVALDHAGQLHAAPDPRLLALLWAASSSSRSRAVSMASACTAANRMRLMCACRRKLSMLYSYSHCVSGCSSRRLTKTMAGPTNGRWLVNRTAGPSATSLFPEMISGSNSTLRSDSSTALRSIRSTVSKSSASENS